MKKEISEAQFIKDLKTVHPNMNKEDIEWHLNLFRQSNSEEVINFKQLAIRKALGNKGKL